MTAIETLLSGLIDYAGLYPPASLDMGAAVGNYLAYRRGRHGYALGRFIVDIARAEELRLAAGDALSSMPLSVIAPAEFDPARIAELTDGDFEIEAIEIKSANPATIVEISQRLPAKIERYFEVPIHEFSAAALDAIAGTRSRAKLRMGRIVSEAFPKTKSTAVLLNELAGRHIGFKATAGLHHPIRSHHRFTYKPDSPAGTMHGFLNLAFAAVLLHFGGAGGEALHTLEEEDPGAWRVTGDAIRCRAFSWSAAQLREARGFFTSFGSCSFTEPINDLEALGWL